jgi:hypothetical protein
MKSGTNKCADTGQKSRMVKTLDEGASRHSNVKTKQKIETKKGIKEKNEETVRPSNATSSC